MFISDKPPQTIAEGPSRMALTSTPNGWQVLTNFTIHMHSLPPIQTLYLLSLYRICDLHLVLLFLYEGGNY